MRNRILALTALLASFAAVAGADGPLQFYSVTPCRIIDTRNVGGPMSNGQIRSFAIANVCGIPATAKMAAFNFAVIPTASGNIIAYPFGTTIPVTSTVNFTAGEGVIANGALMPITPNVTSGLSVQAVIPSGTLNLIIDVTGYLQ